MSLLRLLGAIWSFVLGSLRIILFLCCLLLTIVEASSLAIYVVFYDTYKTVPLASQQRDLLDGIVLLAIFLIGCYGSFYKHSPSLKMFSSLCLLYIIYLFLLILFYMSPDALAKENQQLAERMSALQPKYDWGWKGPVEERPDANQVWDNAQSLMCCGLKGPKDWDAFRPFLKSSNSYPYSCCLEGVIMRRDCNKMNDKIFESGCMERFKVMETSVLLLSALLIGFMLFLSIISCVIANLNFERFKQAPAADTESASRQMPANATLLVNRGAGGNDYTRIHDSDFVKQPAYNDAYNSNRREGDRMYPVVQAMEQNRNPYEEPPPIYKN